MTLELVTIPCLEDNYAFLIHDAASGDTAIIDVPDAAPILAALLAELGAAVLEPDLVREKKDREIELRASHVWRAEGFSPLLA